MPQHVIQQKSSPVTSIVIGVIVLLGLAGAGLYLRHPSTQAPDKPVSSEAKAYLSHLALSDVAMEANENFMKQRVIEVKGKLTNNGDRALQSIDVYCLFYGVNGQEIHRERLPIVNSKSAPLRGGETRAFRLPFDALPDGWNQTMPKMVIAEINFTN
jgi:hypothetical protein